ncbi:hypothetical protein NML43_04600 [Rhodopseudomonas palustris]|uniref:hypothetical protein n=1 Tax=Rhodopseudomonas palustris TaxID=1076 RepID=UPI0020CEBD19|nr:hypothetical protein [Rhodopseudomonas palustris]MCP9626367.1 hypothetical protein [Rhodopseudomonas palustris]
MIDWPAAARAVHVLSVVHWIGGLAFVTFVILPSLREFEVERRLAMFDALERRFAWQARISVLLAGTSGFYLFVVFGHWDRITDAGFWWLHAMIALWAIFMLMLFAAEPLFLHAWFDARARRDPDGAFRVALRGHRVLSTLALITVAGAVGGVHGLF